MRRDDDAWIEDDGLWFNICVNGRPSKKLFEKIVLPKIAFLEKKIEKMKCCQNCKHYKTNEYVFPSCQLSESRCLTEDLWELENEVTR